MSDHSGISYVDASWPIVAGCEKLSAGCERCWAIPTSWRLAHNPHPKVSAAVAGTVEKRTSGTLAWSGLVRCLNDRLQMPLRWRRGRRILVCSQADLFHDKVPDQFIADAFGVMAATPWHTYLVLTKRPKRAQAMLTAGCMGGFEDAVAECLAQHSDGDLRLPLRNVYIGATVEDQAAADSRVQAMADIARFGWSTWVSYEPAIGPVEWAPWMRFLSWAVAGGEAGRGARPVHPAWLRALRDACAAAGVPFNFKQWGEFCPWEQLQADSRALHAQGVEHVFADGARVERFGKRTAGRLLDGLVHDSGPAAQC